MNDLERPKDWMENPYIGKNGKDYHTVEALHAANEEYSRIRNSKNLTSKIIF